VEVAELGPSSIVLTAFFARFLMPNALIRELTQLLKAA